MIHRCFFLLIILQLSCSQKADVRTPKGMVYVPSGNSIEAFFMDESPVTVADFRVFIKETSYTTEAEKFGDAGVFTSETNWQLKKGAYWEFPLGQDEPQAKDDHPVTQISYNDALAYCQWAGKRLPTSDEWEHAAKDAANINSTYNWGQTLVVNEKYKANTWQGSFPYFNTNQDGFLQTSPVGYFGKTKLGLTDISGNVWEWTSDWDLPYGMSPENFQPNQTSQKILRGGSFLCDPVVCHGYQITGKSESTPETSLMHTGFRCVKDIIQADHKQTIKISQPK